MAVPFFDAALHHARLGAEIEAAAIEVLRSGRYILGANVGALEKACAEVAGVPFAIGVSSGTDALLVALMAEGIGPGDEVVTTPFSFFATAGAISRLGATPVFADVDPVTLNLDPRAAADKVGPRTRALLPVHLFGQCADMDAFAALARDRELVLIEDAAQAIGASWGGRPAGSLGDYGCFSFFPTKNLGAAGDAGLVTVHHAERAERVRVLRAHGAKPKYFHALIGGNFRIDELQAAILRVKLPHLQRWNDRRHALAARYTDALRDVPGLKLPVEIDGSRHIFHQYTVRIEGGRRDQVGKALAADGVETLVYYPRPLHLQQCFASLGYRQGSLPEAERAAGEVLSLPIFPELSDTQVDEVIVAVRRALRPA